jgi:hypothetical protein
MQGDIESNTGAIEDIGEKICELSKILNDQKQQISELREYVVTTIGSLTEILEKEEVCLEKSSDSSSETVIRLVSMYPIIEEDGTEYLNRETI